MKPVLSILVISFNTRDMTLACLRSVFEQTTRTPFELIVVDNASTDGSVGAIEAEFSGRVTFIASHSNLGFAAANNLAAERAEGDFLLLLNPDTVVRSGAIDNLMAFAKKHPRAGIWGGRTVFADGSLNATSCFRRSTPWSMFCLATGLSVLFRGFEIFNPECYGRWQRDTERSVDIITGCFLLIGRDLWDRLRGFDQRFFMFGEETDLCMRAATLGAQPMVTPTATIIHHGGASVALRSDRLVRLLLVKEMILRRHWLHGAWFGSLALRAWVLTRRVGWSLLSASVGDRAGAKAREWRSVWARRREWIGGGVPASESSSEGSEALAKHVRGA